MSLAKEIRGAEGLSQEKLEELTGYSRRTIQRKEAMRLPEPEYIADLAARTRANPEYVAREYAEKARLYVLDLIRQKEIPLH